MVRRGSELSFDQADADLVDADEKLDLAMLRVHADFAASPLSLAAAGEQWTVLTRPRPGDPQLTGTVSATDRPIANDDGNEVVVLQLAVDQLLDEQVPGRLPQSPSRRTSCTPSSTLGQSRSIADESMQYTTFVMDAFGRARDGYFRI